MNPDYWVNRKLREALTETGTVPRFVGMWYNERFEIYMVGGEFFSWHPDTDIIKTHEPYLHNKRINKLMVDKSLIRELYNRFISKQNKIKVDPDALIKEELGITKKRLNDKDRETIEKYQHAVQQNKASRQEHSS